MRRIVIFDMDGTLSDDRHRRSLAEAKDFHAYHELCCDDAPIMPTLMLARSLATTHDIALFTGRAATQMNTTLTWLARHGVKPNHVRMRTASEFSTPDFELKQRWAEDYGFTPMNTDIVFEDRDRVVAMWRRLGFHCHQVNYGDF